MKKNEKNEKCEIYEDFHAKSVTISRVCSCCCNFFDEILDDFEYFSDFVLSGEKINNP